MITYLDYINLGTFNDLYDTMNICKETYPPETYGKYNIGKYGLSEKIGNRFTQHKNKTNGYGQYSDDIDLKWLILLSPSQLFKAEKILSNLLRADEFTFNYIDNNNKNHNELIMYKNKDESKVKQIYKQVLALYPSKENELNQLLEDTKNKYEMQLELLKSQCDNKVLALESENKLLKANHRIEMLELQLKFTKI